LAAESSGSAPSCRAFNLNADHAAERAMSLPEELLPLLRRPSLELSEILFLAYGLNPSSWPVAPTKQLRDEILSLHREIKIDIDHFKESGSKAGLKALVRGNEANQRSSVVQSDFIPYVEKKAAVHPERWSQLRKGCDQWQSEYHALPRRKSSRRSTIDIERIKDELNCIRDAVLSLHYDLPVPKGQRSRCAGEVYALKPRVTDWGIETLKDLFGDGHEVANRLAELHGYFPWWRGLNSAKSSSATQHPRRTKVKASG
jgi:hypothetical protein